jgi:DNA polymerase III subunit delta
MPALDFDALMKSVPKGEIAPVYYFYGDQDLLKDEALKLVLEHGLDPATRDFNLDRRRAADLTAEEFLSLVMTPPMMAARRVLVVTEIEFLAQKRSRATELRAAVLQYLAKPSPETLLVLVQSASSDDKDKTDPDIARRAAAVDFKPLEPGRIRKWIRHQAGRIGLAIDDGAVAHLFDVVGEDLAQLASEIAKLKAAVGERPATSDDVSELAGVRRGETVHDFVDAVTGRRFADAAGMVPHLLTAPGQSGVTLLISLGSAVASLGVARALLDGRSRNPASDLKQAFFAARPMGVRDYDERARRWAKDAEQWTAAEVDAAMAALLRADKRLKATSTAGETEIVQEALLSMAAVGVA